MSVVDVRDCAKHHILAMENPNASGRYMCISPDHVAGEGPTIMESKHWNDIFKLMGEVYDKFPAPVPVCDGEPIRPTRFDMAKLDSLMKMSEHRDFRGCLEGVLEEGRKLGEL